MNVEVNDYDYIYEKGRLFVQKNILVQQNLKCLFSICCGIASYCSVWVDKQCQVTCVTLLCAPLHISHWVSLLLWKEPSHSLNSHYCVANFVPFHLSILHMGEETHVIPMPHITFTPIQGCPVGWIIPDPSVQKTRRLHEHVRIYCLSRIGTSSVCTIVGH